MTDTARRRLLTKIQALLAKAASTDSDHEAEAFAQKARELMEAHQIEQYELGQDTDPLGEDLIPLKHDARCYVTLATHAARYFGCEAAFRYAYDAEGSWRRHYRIFGREAARITAALMIEYWTAECMRRARRMRREGRFSSDASAVRQLLEAFSYRLHVMAQRSPARPGQPGLPVPLTEAEAYMRDQIPDLGKLRDTPATHISRSALDEAGKISLALQASGRSPSHKLIGG